MGVSLVGIPSEGFGERPFPPVLQQARARIFKAVKDAKIYFLNGCSEKDVEEMIKEGVMICSSGQAAAEKGRQFSKRPTPWGGGKARGVESFATPPLPQWLGFDPFPNLLWQRVSDSQ